MCRIRLTKTTYTLTNMCEICTEIETREQAIKKKDRNIRQWMREGSHQDTIKEAEGTIFQYEEEVVRHLQERDSKKNNFAR
jgi:hypothetical protein